MINVKKTDDTSNESAFLSFIFILFVLFAASSMAQVVIHEELHAEVYDRYGCENIEISYKPSLEEGMLILGTTTADCPPENSEIINQANQTVHTVYYLLMVPKMLLIAILSILIVY